MATPGLLSHLPPIAYVGRVGCVTGYGGAARHQIHVLRQHGLKLRIHDAGSHGDPDPAHESRFITACRQSDPLPGKPRASIIHLGPNCTDGWRHRVPRPHILVSVWETTRLPASWVEIANSYDQVWCATQWQADNYVASGVEGAKVRHVPFALDPELYPANGPVLPELSAIRAQGHYVFGSMFQWTERKAPRALLGAFLAAFRGEERVTLVLKAYEGDSPTTAVAGHVAEILKSYQPPPGAVLPRIEIITRRLTHGETLAFYRGVDCYVSAHRGEGFGLPIVEALLLERPVIATDWSAPAEYAGGCYAPVNYTLEAPHSMGWQPFYTTDQQWASPDQASLSEWMRRAASGEVDWSPFLSCVGHRLHTLPHLAGVTARAAIDDLLK